MTALCLLGVAADALAASTPVRTTGTPSVPSRQLGLSRAVSQDLQGATLEYIPGEARFDTLTADGARYSRVTVGGALVTETPGKPALPTATLHVGVPDGMSPRLRVVADEWNERAGSAPPSPSFTSDSSPTSRVRLR